MSRIRRRFLYIGLAIATTLLVGTVGFMLVAGYPAFDAFYMTLITMTTVGYAEIHPLTQAGRIFNSFLIIFGVSTIFIAVGAMTQTIVEMEFGEAIGKRRNKRMIDKAEGPLHRVRLRAGGRRRRGRIATRGRAVRGGGYTAGARGAGDAGGADGRGGRFHARRYAAEVGIERARGLVAALATDADNLFVLLTAKGLNPRIYVAARAAEEGAEEKMRRAGADAVFAPYSITGHRLAQSLLRPHVVQFLDFTTSGIGIDAAIEQMRVSETSAMVSRTMQEMQLGRDIGAIVLAIRKRDGRMQFNPPADTAVQGGDYPDCDGRARKSAGTGGAAGGIERNLARAQRGLRLGILRQEGRRNGPAETAAARPAPPVATMSFLPLGPCLLWRIAFVVCSKLCYSPV